MIRHWVTLLATMALCASPGTAENVDRYRTGVVDPRLQQVPADVAQGALSDPSRFVLPLVQSLTQGVENDFHKVKILHDWIANNVEYDMGPPSGDDSFAFGRDGTISRSLPRWEKTMRRRKGKCGGFSNLMLKLCEVAGVECVMISGTARLPLSPDAFPHGWNAVRIGGAWYLIDVTFDAGMAAGPTWSRSYGTGCLFAPPAEFLHLHLPASPKWQLVAPLTADQFAAQPALTGRFFEQGLQLSTPMQGVTPTGASVQFTVEAPPDVLVEARLMSAAGAEQPQRVLVSRDGPRFRIHATFPAPGVWPLVLFSSPSTRGGVLSVGTLRFNASAGTDDHFPIVTGDYMEARGRLDWPLSLPLPTARPVELQVCLPAGQEVFLASDNQPRAQLSPLPEDPTLYRATATVQAGWRNVSLVSKERGGTQFKVLLVFTPKSP